MRRNHFFSWTRKELSRAIGRVYGNIRLARPSAALLYCEQLEDRTVPSSLARYGFEEPILEGDFVDPVKTLLGDQPQAPSSPGGGGAGTRSRWRRRRRGWRRRQSARRFRGNGRRRRHEWTVRQRRRGQRRWWRRGQGFRTAREFPRLRRHDKSRPDSCRHSPTPTPRRSSCQAGGRHAAASARVSTACADAAAAPGGIGSSSSAGQAQKAESSPTGKTQLSYADPDFNTVAGQTYDGVIDSFVDSGDPSASATDYIVTISWGDGSTSAGTVSEEGGSAGFEISGSHAYQTAGNYSVTAQVYDQDDGQGLQVTAGAVVADAALSGQPVTYGAPVGFYQDVIGAFTYANSAALPADFIATVNWGDGSTSNGVVVGRDGLFSVTGMHTFNTAGAYSVGVTVQDNAGTVVSWDSTLYIGSQPAGDDVLLAQDPTITPTAGSGFSGSVGLFTDSSGNTNPAIYSASIDWGDGSSNTAGTVTGSGGLSGFSVSGSHTYTAAGSYTVQVTITDGTDYFYITSTAIVADTPLSLAGTSAPTGVASGTSFTHQVATFTSANSYLTVGQTSGIIAWGDGQSSGATMGTSGSTFTVTGTHTYEQGGTYTATITMSDTGGSSVTATVSVTVAGISTTLNDLSFLVGKSYLSGTAIGSGTDSHAMVGVSGTIYWGDGTSAAATISGGSSFTIESSASHTYSQEGYYTITVALSDTAGDSAVATVNVNVTDGVLAATNSLPTGTQTTLSYSGNVLTFTDTAPVRPATTAPWSSGATAAAPPGASPEAWGITRSPAPIPTPPMEPIP